MDTATFAVKREEGMGWKDGEGGLEKERWGRGGGGMK